MRLKESGIMGDEVGEVRERKLGEVCVEKLRGEEKKGSDGGEVEGASGYNVVEPRYLGSWRK